MTAGLRPAIAKHENPASIVPNADAPELAPVVPGAPALASSFVPTTSVIAIAGFANTSATTRWISRRPEPRIIGATDVDQTIGANAATR